MKMQIFSCGHCERDFEVEVKHSELQPQEPGIVDCPGCANWGSERDSYEFGCLLVKGEVGL